MLNLTFHLMFQSATEFWTYIDLGHQARPGLIRIICQAFSRSRVMQDWVEEVRAAKAT
jgi:hypothetical protein